jgi:hypothetical protein
MGLRFGAWRLLSRRSGPAESALGRRRRRGRRPRGIPLRRRIRIFTKGDSVSRRRGRRRIELFLHH